ncbi:AAA family ATPase [Segetibacter aerophilus]|uniref:YhaN AAA domain-containing protein n=1 Tax=Segetibacter aerophilus TaxID=670293 RepID=A0A512B9U2_9BACT|nr:AAA family ATPase [Segetibacter aerophilus]GEO08722.1 hypothetical protein SAE01_12180 [Segetibacter aerophilus]
MKHVLLKQLRLQNFKGIRERTLTFNGNTNIHGANEAGKSTIFDSFCWLLFGKDQFDRKDHEIKTLDKNNQAIHNLDHEVEAVFSVDGVEERPKRIFKEIWTKKRGEAKPTFTGHETIYFWNNVPLKAGEYQVKVNSIINEGMFKLLTNTLYFNNLPWTGRRAVLLEIAGEITNEQIFDKIATPAESYSKLISILNSGKSAVEYKKEIGVRKLKIKKELEEIPTRISEAERNKPETFNFTALAKQVEEKQAEIALIESSLSDAVKSQSAVNQVLMGKQASLHKLKSSLSELRFKIKSEVQAEQNVGANNVYQAEHAITNLNKLIAEKEAFISGRKSLKFVNYLPAIEMNNSKLEKLRTEWAEIDAREFKFDETLCVCPTCKQMLQQHDIEVKKQELLGNFNVEKLRRLNEKVSQGNKIKEDTAKIQESIATVDAHIAELEEEVVNLKAQLPQLKTRLDTLKLVEANKGSFNIEEAVDKRLAANVDAMNIGVQIANLEAEIEGANNNQGSTNNEELRQQKQSLQLELDGLKAKLSNKAIIEKTDERIKELQRQEEELAQQLADLEQTEFGIEKYNKAKMDILESRINSRFTYVSFKMFERQINGGEVECCECLVNGVPFSVVNTAGKINAGLDIINVLCQHYGVTAPVFIDNRESVSNIIPTQSQIINLIVNPAYSVLLVEAA